ncbi:hypothetical protein H072_5972 [Dactylellina haptotyla CBS 200.50]|uniref:Uncharacterized protein n=1 Tax=Dactylellina haptotyla (strain CBS 200.50) TaxID=1284197 RepID=S8AB78_DACHA|nr:hypothetical protein H072_5972 [Dactylellina haptotyla CBS 200.50]
MIATTVLLEPTKSAEILTNATTIKITFETPVDIQLGNHGISSLGCATSSLNITRNDSKPGSEIHHHTGKVSVASVSLGTTTTRPHTVSSHQNTYTKSGSSFAMSGITSAPWTLYPTDEWLVTQVGCQFDIPEADFAKIHGEKANMLRDLEDVISGNV